MNTENLGLLIFKTTYDLFENHKKVYKCIYTIQNISMSYLSTIKFHEDYSHISKCLARVK